MCFFCCLVITVIFVLGLHAVIQFAWSLTLRVAAQHPQLPPSASGYCEEDDDMIEAAFHGQVFRYLRESVIKSPGFTSEVSDTD